MKLSKLLAATLTLALAQATWAGPNTVAIANMKAWCDCVMVGGVCQVTNAKPLKPGQKVFTAAGPIAAETYEAFRKDPRMCEAGARACEQSWDGQSCREGFRLMFRPEPIVCVRPGDPRPANPASPRNKP